jgi:hypothetical protein
MSRLNVRCLFLWVGLFAAGWLIGPTPTSARADEKSKPSSITVIHGDKDLPDLVMVTLYHEGKPVRSRELKYASGFSDADRVTWTKLAPGRYEVHFEAKGYEKFIKRFILGEEDANVVRVQLDKKETVVGSAGLSLQEMEKQIEALKKKVAELEAEVDKLKKK